MGCLLTALFSSPSNISFNILLFILSFFFSNFSVSHSQGLYLFSSQGKIWLRHYYWIYHKPPLTVVLKDGMFQQVFVGAACSLPQASAEGAWRQKQKQNTRKESSNGCSLVSLGVDAGYWPLCFHVAWVSSQYGGKAPSLSISRKSQVDWFYIASYDSALEVMGSHTSLHSLSRHSTKPTEMYRKPKHVPPLHKALGWFWERMWHWEITMATFENCNVYRD